VVVRITTRLTIATVIINMLLWLMIAVGQSQVLAPLSEVKTIVLDETGAVIPGCETAFSSDFDRIVSHTGPDGSVTVKLRDGKYTLTTNKAGFVKSDVRFSAPMPDPLRITLKVDHTPTDGGIFEGVPTSSSQLPNIIEPEPAHGPSAQPTKKSRSWQCLYLWKCSRS
jgi:hypothetical protein